MSFFKFLRNLFGSSETTEETIPTKVAEPVVCETEKLIHKTVSTSETPTKVDEPVKISDESTKTAKEIKAKVKRPSNNQNSNNQNGQNTKPRPKRRRPSPKKPKTGEQ